MVNTESLMAETLLEAPDALAGQQELNPAEEKQLSLQEGEYDEVIDNEEDNADSDNKCYYALVIDSGPIIKLTGLSSLRDSATKYYTTPSVIKEIRDTKAREHLEQLPFEIITRDPTPESIKKVIDFARLTGDYQSLSSVDIQVLALLYDLEIEGCCSNNVSIDHIRRKPKRMVGVGRIEALNKGDGIINEEEKKDETIKNEHQTENGVEFFQKGPSVPTLQEQQRHQQKDSKGTNETSGPKTWAMLVNPTVTSTNVSEQTSSKSVQQQKLRDNNNTTSEKALHVTFGDSMNLSESNNKNFSVISGNDDVQDDGIVDGQFSDAEDDEEIEYRGNNYDDDDYEYGSDCDISDEECDVIVLDPEEAEERKRKKLQEEGIQQQHLIEEEETRPEANEEKATNDFPSLSEAMRVPYEGSDDESHDGNEEKKRAAIRAKEEAEMRKEESLKPVSKSGKSYNSFKKYKNIVTAKGVVIKNSKEKEETPSKKEDFVPETPSLIVNGDEKTDNENQQQSRIMGGLTMSGQGTEVDDDGEGWITCTKDIRKMKATGSLDPGASGKKNTSNNKNQGPPKNPGPPMKYRTACATTDFAMQNVILQMNFELLSVDGMKVRKLKSWVTRCGACYTVYADGNDTSSNVRGMNKRLFCSKCGSDMIQRIAASVDGKTGRLRLHLSKKYKHNLRGTKFSLPKPGTHNRFQGDLLLREDQLLMGAWNQKVKKQSGGKAAYAAQQSIFGSDLATTVGCFADNRDDIKVGFGRRNPNASKYGRERRGKKKKSHDKACGLRRY